MFIRTVQSKGHKLLLQAIRTQVWNDDDGDDDDHDESSDPSQHADPLGERHSEGGKTNVKQKTESMRTIRRSDSSIKELHLR